MATTIPLHTVVVLCGPTMCGKTTWANSLRDVLRYNQCTYLSSDQIRTELLGYDAHRHSPVMLSVSRQAFDLLFAKLRAAVSHPVDAEYVIVDTRGADETFRADVCKIAKDNGYNTCVVTFEYKNRSDYYTYCSYAEHVVVEKDVNRFLRKVLPTVRSRDFDMRLRITSRIVASTHIEAAPQRYNWVSCNKGRTLAVIGDTHECMDEMMELVDSINTKYATEDQSVLFVHVGDYLDKGSDTAAMLHAMTFLVFGDQGHILVRGNHEHYVYQRLTGALEPNEELEAQYFQSLKVLQSDVFLKDMFIKLHESSMPYVRVFGEDSRDVIVTHAPCPVKHLGKFSVAAERAQRNFYVKNREGDIREELEFVFKEADISHPLHVFGHVAHRSESLVYKNKVFLDTGAVHGGKLTAFVMTNNHYEFVQVDCRQRWPEGVHTLPDNITQPIKDEKKFNIFEYEMSPYDWRLLRNVMDNGVKYISGTMPPAPSTADSLESLDSAFNYFQRKGVDVVAIQPKYMGSRCQMYLSRSDDEQSFCVSRSGWVIRHVEGLDDLIQKYRAEVFGDPSADGWENVILDGELLPWSALGRDLINKEFVPYGELVQKELSLLEGDTGFTSLQLGQEFDTAGRLKDLRDYSQALILHTKDTPLDFRPFDILALNGQVVKDTTASQRFAMFNKDPYLEVVLSSEQDRAGAREFYHELTAGRGMEGVVVKPLKHHDGVTPYMKVRNPEYLRLVYGYDYRRREDKLIRQKNISGKAATAVREHAMAMQMLGASDDLRKELTVKLIAELRKEKEFDPRL